MDPLSTGIIMGLILAGGSFTTDRTKPVLTFKVQEADQEPLQLLASNLGGRIYGPYHHGGRHYVVYHLRGTALRHAVPLFVAHLPESRKRRQFMTWATSHGLIPEEVDPNPPPA